MNRCRILVGLTLMLGACQPVAGGAAAPSSGAPEAVPASADWHFLRQGETADLAFSEGVAAARDSLFRLECRQNAQRVRADWQGEGPAVLTSRTATGTFRKGDDHAADHPVFSAFRAGGSLSVGRDDTDLTLTAGDAGRAQIAAFFDFCTRPLPRPAPEPTPAPVEDAAPPSEGDDQPDDLSGVEPVEAGVDVVQPDDAAHQPVDR